VEHRAAGGVSVPDPGYHGDEEITGAEDDV